jgi:hypothetical protein
LLTTLQQLALVCFCSFHAEASGESEDARMRRLADAARDAWRRRPQRHNPYDCIDLDAAGSNGGGGSGGGGGGAKGVIITNGGGVDGVSAATVIAGGGLNGGGAAAALVSLARVPVRAWLTLKCTPVYLSTARLQTAMAHTASQSGHIQKCFTLRLQR